MSSSSLSDNIANVLSIARLAPSVHNTQPWRVKVLGSTLIISRDPTHILRFGDPTGRQTQLSMGMFTESCVIALRGNGFSANSIQLKNNGDIVIDVSSSNTKADQVLTKSLKTRFTDRSVYKKTPVEPATISAIENSWRSENVSIKVVTDEAVIRKSAELTEKGLQLAFSNPEFREELSNYIVSSNKSKYGIPIPALRSNIKFSWLMKALIRSGSNRKHESRLEFDRWNSASGLVFILAAGDSNVYWFESGRAYLRASLAIEQAGLRQATSAALVEATDFHEDIEKMLQTPSRIQAFLRIGASNAKPYYSGRLEPEEILTT